MTPRVHQTEQSVGNPEIMTTLIPCMILTRPVWIKSEWKTNKPPATATIPSGKICQNRTNEYLVTELVIGTGPVRVIVRPRH